MYREVYKVCNPRQKVKILEAVGVLLATCSVFLTVHHTQYRQPPLEGTGVRVAAGDGSKGCSNHSKAEATLVLHHKSQVYMLLFSYTLIIPQNDILVKGQFFPKIDNSHNLVIAD